MKGRTYKYFQGKPLYPFAHGLSYTEFAYENLAFDGANGTGTVKNTGAMASGHAIPVFVKDPEEEGVNSRLAGFCPGGAGARPGGWLPGGAVPGNPQPVPGAPAPYGLGGRRGRLPSQPVTQAKQQKGRLPRIGGSPSSFFVFSGTQRRCPGFHPAPPGRRACPGQCCRFPHPGQWPGQEATWLP